MILRRHIAALAFALSALQPFSLPAFSSRPNLAVVADENAAVVMLARDIPKIISLWDKSPLAAIANDPGVRQFNEQIKTMRAVAPLPVTDDSPNIEAIAKQVLGMTRSILVTSSDFDPYNIFATLVVAVDFGDNIKAAEQFITKLLTADASKGGAHRKTENHNGVTIHEETSADASGKKDSIYWASVDSVLIGSGNRAKLITAINRLKKTGNSMSFAMTPRHTRMMNTVGMAQITCAINIKPILAAAQKTAASQLAQNPATAMINPGALNTVLGLDTLDDAFFGVIFDSNDMQLSGACTYAATPRGLMKILAPKRGALPQPPFLPDSWPAAAVTNLDIGDTVATLRESIQTAFPFLGSIIEQQIAGINQKTGINLENDLLQNINGSIITGQYKPAGGNADTSAFLALPLKQPETFAASLQKAFAAAEISSTPHRLGNFTIHRVSNGRGGPGSTFEYAVIQDHFLACGGSGGVEEAVRCWAGQTASIWNDPKLHEMASLMPAHLCGLSRSSLRELARAWFFPVGLAMQRAAMSTPSDVTVAPEQQLPSPTFDTLAPYHAYTCLYRKDDGAYFRTKITAKK